MSIKYSANEILTCVPANQREGVVKDDKFGAFTFFNCRSRPHCLFFSLNCKKKKTYVVELVDFKHILFLALFYYNAILSVERKP